ncbi:MAG: hypothetical protein CFE44_12855 [Burkholderiales bacterium PBB4]|nr:MAG: hypothetical protein CFE44_12855 [Burkholderiales bacterium PBB4]
MAGLQASLAQYPRAHVHDLPIVLGQRNKTRRRNQAQACMFPAHQGFKASDTAIGTGHLGLEKSDQLPALHAAVQVVVQPVSRRKVSTCVVCQNRELLSWLRCGAGHGNLCPRQQ